MNTNEKIIVGSGFGLGLGLGIGGLANLIIRRRLKIQYMNEVDDKIAGMIFESFPVFFNMLKTAFVKAGEANPEAETQQEVIDVFFNHLDEEFKFFTHMMLEKYGLKITTEFDVETENN